MVFITWQGIVLAASVVSAIGLLCGIILKVHKWYLMQENQNDEINRMKEENTLICYALSACLDGLEQLGANHSVPEAREKLRKYLNQQAHK